MTLPLAFAAEVLTRYLLVCLFFPFSALDKILNFEGAVQQAQATARSHGLAVVLILAGLAVEILMPIGILTGYADRLAAFVLAGYCVVTALLWKQWWRPGDFWARGQSKARDLLWDFLKNFSLAGGFLLLAVGIHVADAGRLLADPLASTHPYARSQVPSESGPGAAHPFGGTP